MVVNATHVPRTSLKSNMFLMSSTCFFHDPSPPGSPFSLAMSMRRGGEDAVGREGACWFTSLGPPGVSLGSLGDRRDRRDPRLTAQVAVALSSAS